MMKRTSIKESIFYQMIYEVFALAIPLITSPYISRVLGAEKIGEYSYTYSVATYFGMLIMLGVKNHGNREIAKVRDSKELVSHTFINIYVIQITMAILTILMYVFYCITFAEYKLLAIIQLLYVISYLFDINWLFFGLEKFKQTSIRNMIIKIGTFISTFIFVRNQEDLWKYCFILACGAFFSEIMLWAYIPKCLYLCKPDWKEVKSNIIPMLVLFIPILATSIFNFMDKIMVGILSSKIQLGLYENGEKITNCIKTVILSIGTVMMPRMSYLSSAGDERKTERYMSLSIELIMFLAFAFSFGVAVVAKEFAPIYWGEDFSKCDVLLQGLCIALPFSAFGNYVRTQYMIPNNMDKQYIFATVLSAIINVTFNFVLIPLLGALGAVIGTIIAEAGLCIVQFAFVQRKKNLIIYIKKSIPYFCAGVAMFVLTEMIGLGIDDLIAKFVLKIVFGCLIYLLLVVFYITISKNEIYNEIRIRWRKK